jgi:hypothetical protein
MQPEKANKREVSQHLVETVTSKVSSHRVRIALVVVHLQLLVDVRLVHQGVENIQHRVHIPNLWIPLQRLNFILSFLCKLAAELAERLELVDELVDDLPQPLVGQLQVDGRLRGEDVVEELAVVVVALEPLVDGGAALDSSIDVAEVELPVKVQEDGVVVDIRGNILCLWPW